MKRVSQMALYRLGNLTRLREMAVGQEPSEAIVVEVVFQLRAFISNSEYQNTVSAAVEKAQAIFRMVRETLDANKPITQYVVDKFEQLLSAFEVSLDDDLTRLPTFMVEPVGAYSFGQLINHADAVFPLNMRDGAIIPSQALLDFRSAGACLAFDLPTACGFHVFRATDAMLRKYCEHFEAMPKGNGRDWGKFIGALRDKKSGRMPNARTTELLDKIRDIDRNPLVHPELSLDRDGALLVFDLCKSAISLMAMDIKNVP